MNEKNIDPRVVEAVRAYQDAPTLGGVWVRSRYRELKLKDGAGLDRFDLPNKTVGTTRARWFKNLDKQHLEGSSEFAVVSLPAPGAEGSPHPKGWCDVDPSEWRFPPVAGGPTTANEARIAKQRDEAEAAARARADELETVRALAGNAMAEAEALRELAAAREAELAELRAALASTRTPAAPPAAAPSSASDARPGPRK